MLVNLEKFFYDPTTTQMQLDQPLVVVINFKLTNQL